MKGTMNFTGAKAKEDLGQITEALEAVALEGVTLRYIVVDIVLEKIR